MARENITKGVRMGLTSIQGLIAQGRGEAFDYFLGESTTASAFEATKAATIMLLLAEKPVLSVNGNVAALVPKEMVMLANELKAPLEINLFHRTEERVEKIAKLLRSLGAKRVLGENPDVVLPLLDHARAKSTRDGIYDADVVMIPLEDGDRCEALVRMGKKVVAVDLNPLSRTAKMATITIVDNIIRVVPNMIASVREFSCKPIEELQVILSNYDNNHILRQAVKEIRANLDRQFEEKI